MSYCLNPICSAPDQNTPTANFCLSCGENLLLKGRYRAQRLLGQGGFGKTFKAIDEDLPRKPLCVIKQFTFISTDSPTRQVALQLFYQEAQQLEALGRHSQIPELLAYFDIEGQPYLVQEFIDGQDLQQELNDLGAFDQQKVRDLLGSLLPVLDFLHSGSVPIIHRDLKTANIIRRYRDHQLILVDFGAAKQATQSILAKTGTQIGSVEYSAPEQIKGKPTFASDLFSLGVTCIHLLTQVSPFDLFDINSDTWVWRDYLANNPVDQQLGEVLDKMIANSLPLRYQSAVEVLQALNIEQKSSSSSSSQLEPSQSINFQNAKDFYSQAQSKEEHDFLGALADYNKGIELDPNNAIAYNNRSLMKLKLNDISGALADVNKAIELDPSLSGAYHNRSVLKRVLNDISGALADVNKAIELDPSLSSAYHNRGGLKGVLNDISGALADVNKAIELNPEESRFYISRGAIKHDLGNIKGFKRLKLWVGSYVGRGHLKFDDVLGALADFNKGIELAPEIAFAYNARGWLKDDKLNDIAGALADYSKAIELDPEFANAYYCRGALRANKIKDSTAAIQDFRRAASLYRQQDGTSKYIQWSINYLKQLGVTE
jgi:serine/threonine protein kinase